MDNSQTTIVRKKDKALLVAIGVIVIVMVCIAILGILLMFNTQVAVDNTQNTNDVSIASAYCQNEVNVV